MLRSWTNRYRHRRLQRRAIDILHTLDDHRLADIGTFRDSIELFVEARVPGKALKDKRS